MPSPTDFNLSPYFDDYAESKKFHRVLFRPAFAVQARELTQSQTILQNQIERISDHLFEKGAMVIPGEIAFDLNYYAVKLTSKTYATVAEYVGKLPPDTMAEVCYKWANMYSCFVVIDITGGMGVSTARKMQEMGYKDTELDRHKGDVLYIENRAPITRAADQTENIKLVIEF